MGCVVTFNSKYKLAKFVQDLSIFCVRLEPGSGYVQAHLQWNGVCVS